MEQPLFNAGTGLYDVESTSLENLTVNNLTIGSVLDAGGNKIINLAMATSPNDGASKAYVDSVAGQSAWLNNGNNIYFPTYNVGVQDTNPAYPLSVGGTIFAETDILLNDTTAPYPSTNYLYAESGVLKWSGNNVVLNPMVNDLDTDGYTITNVPTPTNPNDVANKAYVDSQAHTLATVMLAGNKASTTLDMSSNSITNLLNATMSGTLACTTNTDWAISNPSIGYNIYFNAGGSTRFQVSSSQVQIKTVNLNMNTQKITNVASPSASGDAVNLGTMTLANVMGQGATASTNLNMSTYNIEFGNPMLGSTKIQNLGRLDWKYGGFGVFSGYANMGCDMSGVLYHYDGYTTPQQMIPYNGLMEYVNTTFRVNNYLFAQTTPSPSANMIYIDGATTQLYFRNSAGTVYQITGTTASVDYTSLGASGTSQTTTNNTRVGGLTMVLTTGSGNSAFGYKALTALTSGIANTSVGFQSGQSLLTGGYNTLLGNTAGGSLTTASDNVLIGYYAGSATSINTRLVNIGSMAGYYAKGDDNVFIGYSSGLGVALTTTGTQNVGLGTNTLKALTTGQYNTCIGYNAGQSITTGNQNCIVGANSSVGASNGQCCIMGYNCVSTASATNENIYGYSATGQGSNTTVINNTSTTKTCILGTTTCINGTSVAGNLSGTTNLSISGQFNAYQTGNNVCGIETNWVSGNYGELRLGYAGNSGRAIRGHYDNGISVYTNNGEIMRCFAGGAGIDMYFANGNGSINYGNRYHTSQIYQTITETGYTTHNTHWGTWNNASNEAYLYLSQGQLAIGVANSARFVFTTTTIVYPSDSRIKTNIRDLSDGFYQNVLDNMKPVEYDLINKQLDDRNTNIVGFIAQDVKNVLPNAVYTEEDYINNIQKNCDVSGNIVSFQEEHGIVIDDIHLSAVRLWKGELCYDFSFSIIDDYSIKLLSRRGVDCDKDISNNFDGIAFCDGQRVNDFNRIDKNYLYSITFGCVKMLNNQVKSQASQIIAQEQRILQLEAKLNQLIKLVGGM